MLQRQIQNNLVTYGRTTKGLSRQYGSVLWVMFLLLAVLISACKQSSDSNGPEHILRFGHIANENDIWHKAALRFAKEVKERSGGRIEVRVYPNEQMGSEREMIISILTGSLDLTITGESLLNWSVPNAVLIATPYAIRDSEHLQKIAGGPVGEAIEQQVLQVTGLRPIAWFERGARNLTSNRPVTHPDDLRGMIIRVPDVSMFVTAWRSLGARPTPMAFSEVFTALQQSTIHAQENPLALIRSAGFYEVQDYVNLTEHVKGWIYVVIGNERLESLPDDLQQVVLESARAMQAYEHKLYLQQVEEDYLFLKDRGMEFIEVDREAFEEIVREAVRLSLSGETEILYRRMQEF